MHMSLLGPYKTPQPLVKCSSSKTDMKGRDTTESAKADVKSKQFDPHSHEVNILVLN